MFDRIADLAKLMSRMDAVDLSPRLERGIPRWITHPHLVIDPTMTHDHDGYYCQSISMAEHTGAHVDAPSHALADRMHETIDKVAPDHLIASAVVYKFADRNLQPGDLLTAVDFLACEDAHGERVGEGEIALVDCGWMRRYWRTDSQAPWYAANQPGFDESAVVLLRERGVRAVGSDTIACETPIVNGKPGPAPGHAKHWLPNGILIMEGLANLEKLPARCFFIAVPLNIHRGSGSPIRPVALVER
jgi:kynurenine formamidase